MRVLLFGAAGQLGWQLQRALLAHSQIQLLSVSRDGLLADGTHCAQVDVTSATQVADVLAGFAPDWVVNAAAYTAVDKAESHAELAFAVNASFPQQLAQACVALRCGLLHYSTDYVFAGDGHRPYTEDSPPAPQNVYGKSKLAGEKAIVASGCHHLILRTAWVYAAHGHNFLQTLLRLAKQPAPLRVVADQIGTPTPAHWLADISAQLLLQNAPAGVWHVVASGQTSWHGFAKAIVEGAYQRGLLLQCPDVQALRSVDFPTPAKRPAYSVLDNQRIQQQCGVQLPHWQDGLHQVLDALQAQAGGIAGNDGTTAR